MNDQKTKTFKVLVATSNGTTMLNVRTNTVITKDEMPCVISDTKVEDLSDISSSITPIRLEELMEAINTPGSTKRGLTKGERVRAVLSDNKESLYVFNMPNISEPNSNRVLHVTSYKQEMVKHIVGIGGLKVAKDVALINTDIGQHSVYKYIKIHESTNVSVSQVKK